MKKLALVAVAIISATTSNAVNVTSHTFFSVPPHFESWRPERIALFRNGLLNQSPDSKSAAFQAVLYGSETTTDGSYKIARFFLPSGCGTNCLNFKEFNPASETEDPFSTQDNDPAKDVDATHFNIRTVNQNFLSSVCFYPEQKVFGIGLTYKQRLSTKCDGSTAFWFEASAPIERVQNSICLVEDIINDGGGPITDQLGLDGSPVVGSVKAAFAQKSWRYGKIDNRCRLEKWGIADIELKIGYTSITYPDPRAEHSSLNSYIGLLIPTGSCVKNKYMFEPVVGNNGHFGIIAGNSIGFKTYKCGHLHVGFFLDTNTQYLFYNNQLRSFDLIGKPFSRYMEVYNGPEEASIAFDNKLTASGTSGINVFSKCMRVYPHFSADINSAVLATYIQENTTFVAEFGFNLYVRQSEVVEIINNGDILDNVGLKSATGLGGTNDARTIKDNFPRATVQFDQGYEKVTDCDIDFESAAHPAIVSHTAYASLGYRRESDCPCFAAIGGSWEFTSRPVNNAIERWTVWGKMGITF